MGKANYRLTLVLVAGLVVFAGCDNPTGSKDASSDEDTPGSSEWTWMSGNTIANLSGSYGAKGTANPSNRPGARDGAVSWRDDGGDLWLFGGEGYDSGGSLLFLNDLWRFDGDAWTWVSGSATEDEAGSYGTKSVTDGANVPGARKFAVPWRDDSGNLWLFGGFRFEGRTSELFNDLWRFDGDAWTWVSGSSTADEAGTYGTKGVANAANVPGARYGAVSWRDDAGDLWLFGGEGYDVNGTAGYLNDLWRFDGAAWTWVSGSKTGDESGSYGTKGVADATNVPGARYGAVSWKDDGGNLWLFGGRGKDGEGSTGYLDDLWRLEP